MNDIMEPFDWWHSGQFWYCSLQRHDLGKVSGCGLTKERAVADARRDLLKLEGKQRLRTAHQSGNAPHKENTPETGGRVGG